ncbi:hypothetical protein [Paracoccus saliphilus]|uniref:Uncharacterized protein n=1 Tax=Paracoccus saliphilus TaxID=405559 RepID=A0AA45W407_9RHOB|nr:hypothetical protein [Paracoccus saliphilus]WCR04245.1 hypothetical protein JHX88_05780 [Paracoccus saliphilus]SIS80562.1 hypothetical protein SAMN05421772_105131 [Paracoccus saliphilus]
MIRAALMPLVLAAAPALSQEVPNDGMVHNCNDATRADTIAEPWEDNTATYSDGAIRIARLDFTEPAAAAVKLLVLSPPHDELGLRQCRVVSLSNGMGFYDIDFAQREASYDPQRGLTIAMPARQYLPESDQGGDDGWFQLFIMINQQSGEITTQGFK